MVLKVTIGLRTSGGVAAKTADEISDFKSLRDNIPRYPPFRRNSLS